MLAPRCCSLRSVATCLTRMCSKPSTTARTAPPSCTSFAIVPADGRGPQFVRMVASATAVPTPPATGGPTARAAPATRRRPRRGRCAGHHGRPFVDVHGTVHEPDLGTVVASRAGRSGSVPSRSTHSMPRRSPSRCRETWRSWRRRPPVRSPGCRSAGRRRRWAASRRAPPRRRPAPPGRIAAIIGPPQGATRFSSRARRQ